MKELSEAQMLESLALAPHRGMQPVIDAIIDLAEAPARSRSIHAAGQSRL